MTQTWTHKEYSAREIVMGLWTAKPKVMIAVSFPKEPGDMWKTRACGILEQFKPYYSHRLGYVVSRAEFAKFQMAMRIMSKVDALAAIAARKNGEWDHPALVAVGALTTDPAFDIETIQRRFLTDCGFAFGGRDPRVKPDYPGRYMVVESLDEIGDPDGWAIVGDDMRALINEAFDYADSAGYDD